VVRSVYYFTDSGEFGGAEQALLILLENLDRGVWQPTLLYHESAAVERLARRAAELEVALRPVQPMPLGLTGARRVPAFTRLLRSAKPAVFHGHLSWPLAAKYGLAAAVLARVPAIVATVQLFPDFQLDRSNYLQERLLAKGIGRYIAVSHDMGRRLSATFDWPADKIEVIHNSVQVERFQCPRDPDLRRELTGDTNRPIVLTAARLDVQKGLDVLLEAAAKISEACFVLAGEGPERERLKAHAAALEVGDRFRFLGHREDIPALLAAADVFVLPSLFEGSSLAVLEAMAAGKPVISSAIGGTDELIVDGESGLLVPAGDPAALADALRRLLADRELSRRLGAVGRCRALQNFSASATAERVVRIYDDLLVKTRGERG
jgi:glycosyltransferase involved in cell wall biosynthesis